MTTTRKNLDLIGVFFGLRFHVVQFGLHVDNCCIPLLHLWVKSNEIKKIDQIDVGLKENFTWTKWNVKSKRWNFNNLRQKKKKSSRRQVWELALEKSQVSWPALICNLAYEEALTISNAGNAFFHQREDLGRVVETFTGGSVTNDCKTPCRILTTRVAQAPGLILSRGRRHTRAATKSPHTLLCQKIVFLHLADSLHIAVEVSQQLVRALEPKKDIQSN